MISLHNLIGVVLFLLFSAEVSFSEENEGVSAEAFGALPEIMSVQLSPDGKKILMLKNIDGEVVLVTKTMQEDSPENIIPYQGGVYNWAFWASNDRIVASIRYIGHENRSRSLTLKVQRRLLSMTWDGKNIINPNRFKKVGKSNIQFSVRQPQVQDQIIDVLRNDPDHVLIQMDVNRPGEPAVYKLNIKTTKRTRVISGRRSVDYWMTDKDHVVRYGEGFKENRSNKTVRHVAFYRKSRNDGWNTLFDYVEFKEDRPFYFEGYTEDPNIIFITADDENGKRALFTYNVDRKEKVRKIVGGKDYDIVDVSINDDFEVEYFSYYREKFRTIRLSEEGKELDKLIVQLFPDKTVSIGNQSYDKTKSILYVSSPTTPRVYYYLDTEKQNLKKIGENYAAVDHDRLSKMTPVTYLARDGLKIPAYLSLPKGAAGKKHPTIIMPHGGPMARDGWSFDYWTQFLTARGYAVLQMNYRGSTGYGETFRALGHNEWGGKMLDDINDGALWAITEGYADPDRICIMGGSYGGYAALQSLVLNEVSYQCAIAYAPISNLNDLMLNLRDMNGFDGYRNYIESDQWTFDDVSPSEHIDKINVPVLIMHGTSDMSVPLSQSKSFVRRMRDANKNINYIEFENGDHSLSSENHRIRFLKETGSFLEKHLKQ